MFQNVMSLLNSSNGIATAKVKPKSAHSLHFPLNLASGQHSPLQMSQEITSQVSYARSQQHSSVVVDSAQPAALAKLQKIIHKVMALQSQAQAQAPMYGSFSLLLTSELTSLSIPEFKVLITLSNFSLPNLGKGWSKADYIRCIVREVVNGNIVGLTGVVIGGGVGIDNKENGIPRTPLTNATSTAITTATTTATNNATTTASSSNNKKQVWLLVKTNPWNQRISPTTNTLFLNLDDRVIYSAAPSLESLDTRHFISAKRSISYDALEVHDADLDHIDGKNMTAIPPNRSSYTAPNPFDPASPYNSTHGHIQGHTNQEPLFTISTLTRPPQSSDFGLHLTIGVRGSFEVDGVRRLSSASDNNIAVGDLVVAVAGKGTQGRTLREVRQDLDLSTGGR